jgi:dihydrofolate reductase
MVMRKIVAGLFISLDGVVESPHLWQFDHFDAGMADAMNAFTDATDTILLGRVTYQEWSGYWPSDQVPKEDADFAEYINKAPKYVVSNTLTQVAWGEEKNIKLLNEPLDEALLTLKKQPGRDISVAGSPTLVQRLLRADLLDALTLMIHPVLAGKGKRLFGDGDIKRLQLTSSKATPSGVLLTTYRKHH